MRQNDLSPKRNCKTASQRLHKRVEEVTQQARQLRALLSYSSRTEQRMRQRHAKVLQEHIQQQLFAARMRLSSIRPDNAQELGAVLKDIDSILLDTLEAARTLTMDLSPAVLYEGGLIGSLEWLAECMKVKHKFTVHLDIDSRAEPAALDTRFLLFDCARELLLNAVKHSGVQEARLALSAIGDGKIKLVVSDGGRGFDPDLLNLRTPDMITFGILSMTEKVAQFGGELDVQAAEGRGACFTLVAPSDTCTVLICDDHAIVRAGYARLLQSEPGMYVVAQAADGRRAIELADELSPDVVIMDVTLPDMDGYTATRRILEVNPRIQVIGLSMHDEEEIAKAMLDAGAVQYMLKTESHENLVAAIKACRDRRNRFADPFTE